MATTSIDVSAEVMLGALAVFGHVQIGEARQEGAGAEKINKPIDRRALAGGRCCEVFMECEVTRERESG